MNEGYCRNCRNRESRPYYYKDYCPTIDEYVREDDDKIIGMINIRLALNDFLKKEGGHIGYCIRPTERRKHYATDMLNSALKVCDTLGIKEVILTCDKLNVASSNVIKNCNGELVEEFYSETFKEDIQKYIIKR